MSRQELRYTRTSLSGGLNEDTDNATMEECADCRNVWRPHGRVVSRPGFVGWSFVGSPLDVVTFAGRAEKNGVFSSPVANVLDLSGMSNSTDDRWYLGHTSRFNSVRLTSSTANTNNTVVALEYWNGTTWKRLHFVESGTRRPENLMEFKRAARHIEDTGHHEVVFQLVAPTDWATTVVNGASRYWVRFVIQGEDTSAGCDIDLNGVTLGGENVRGLHVAQYEDGKQYYILSIRPVKATNETYIYAGDRSDSGTKTGSTRFVHNPETVPVAFGHVSNMAVVPQFNEAFIAHANMVYRVKNPAASYYAPVGNSNIPLPAKVEDGDFAIGPAAPYDKRYVSMLGGFPRANFVLFYSGRLWLANMQGGPYTIRWSAAVPYHKVWTSLAFEYLMEDDNSPITGLAGLGEQVVVFKRDSIWLMIPIGANEATGVEHYVPKRVVAGVGCIAHSSIKKIHGELVFLADDGIYAFDGTPSIRKITQKGPGGPDRLHKTISNLSSARKRFASAAHWRSRSVYLLSVTSAGKLANDLVLVWDYEKDTWWVWDGIEAEHWMEDEGAEGDDVLYFGDQSGRIFRFNVGMNDNGTTISSYVQTQRLGFESVESDSLRGVHAITTNDTRDITVTITKNDSGPSSSSSMALTDIAENDWDSFSWASGAATDDNWSEESYRQKRTDVQSIGSWFTVRLAHSTKDQPFRLSRLFLGTKPSGVR